MVESIHTPNDATKVPNYIMMLIKVYQLIR
jgi:hypothetical protein